MPNPRLPTNGALTEGPGLSYRCRRTPPGRSEDTTRRRQAFVLVVMVSLALWPGRAWADKPERLPIPTEDLCIPAGACPFPVSFHVVPSDGHSIRWSDPAGNPDRKIIEGQRVLERTHPTTGS